MITNDVARHFADDWIGAWNAHDLERILAHYTDDFEMSSPIIAQLMDEPSGILRGKDTMRVYWSRALARLPDLHFELLEVFAGAGSVTITYHGPRGLGAEVLWFDCAGKVYRAAAHYRI